MITQTLPGVEASYKDLLKIAQAQPLARKIDNALALMRAYEQMAIELSNDGFYLAFSGGKDSIVLHELARLVGVRFLGWYNQTTIDPPELVRSIKSDYPQVKWNRPKKNLIMRMEDEPQGPPTRLARWCCEIYKEQGGIGTVKLIGVRAAESPRRAAAWKEVSPHRKGEKHGIFICPILYWTDDDVWSFIRGRGLKYPSLYDEGFKRLGCIGCPMSGPDGAKRDFARWPGFERLWRIGFQRYWARWKGVPRKDGKPRWIERFERWEQLWDWWVSRESWSPADDCQMTMNFSGEDDDDD